MKFFVVFFTLTLLVNVQGFLTDEEKDKTEIAQKECLEESGADPKLVTKARTGDFDFDDAKTKQFFLCFFNKHKILDNEGNLIKTAIPMTDNKDDRKKLDKIIDTCLDKKGETMEDIAWNYQKCIVSKFLSEMFEHRNDA